MILSDLLPAGQFSILATDVDEAVLARAKEGVYTQKNIALVPQDKVAKYLRRSGSTYLIAPEAKKEIQFKKQDLLTDAYMGTFDLIVCRNVLIYFKDEAKEAIYYRFNRSLNPGGILFVGSTEQIFNPDKYGFQAIRPFFYQKL
jgi:chemotaxis protein methyltransferase CheR